MHSLTLLLAATLAGTTPTPLAVHTIALAPPLKSAQAPALVAGSRQYGLRGRLDASGRVQFECDTQPRRGAPDLRGSVLKARAATAAGAGS